jgi:predicted nucleic acid-binding protein
VRVLLDTNILLRTGALPDPKLKAIDSFLGTVYSTGAELCVCSQNLTEFWAVATRPAPANGFGLSPAAARSAIDSLLATLRLLPDPPDLLVRWLGLCTTHQVQGRQAYDARLVAVMQGNGIAQLATLNAIDFRRYSGLILLSPEA